VAQNKPDYSTFQPSLQKLHKMTPFTLVAQRQIRKQKSNVHLNYSAVINILCDVIADVVDVNVKMHPLTSEDSALICALRVENGWGANTQT